MALTISPCKTKRELKLFERIPELLHRSDPHYVPPFPGSIVKIFDPKSPYQRHGELLPFVAFRNGQAVGRIAAVVNNGHNEHYKDKLGFFGFFDCANDVEVARALVDRAKAELKSRGRDGMRGPYNPTVNDECGLLVEGFDSDPMVMMPYNPPYYLDLYEKVGLKPARDMYAFQIEATTLMPERIEKIVKRVKRSTGLELRNIDMKNLDRDLAIIATLYNETLDRNWGFVPITLEDLQFAANDLKAIVDPEMIMIAEKNGVPAGFSMTIPNVNEFMASTKNNGMLMRILKFAWQLKTKTPRRARLAILGVRAEFRSSGVATLFYFETLMRGKQKFTGGELSWVEESNKEMISSIEVMGGKRYKAYRIYEAPLPN